MIFESFPYFNKKNKNSAEMNLFKKAVEIGKMKVEGAMQKNPLEKALFNVTSNLENIPAHSDMELIADETNHFDESKVIMKWISKKLNKNNNMRVIIRVKIHFVNKNFRLWI